MKRIAVIGIVSAMLGCGATFAPAVPARSVPTQKTSARVSCHDSSGGLVHWWDIEVNATNHYAMTACQHRLSDRTCPTGLSRKEERCSTKSLEAAPSVSKAAVLFSDESAHDFTMWFLLQRVEDAPPLLGKETFYAPFASAAACEANRTSMLGQLQQIAALRAAEANAWTAEQVALAKDRLDAAEHDLRQFQQDASRADARSKVLRQLELDRLERNIEMHQKVLALLRARPPATPELHHRISCSTAPR